jgi:outer membrane protein TolC
MKLKLFYFFILISFVGNSQVNAELKQIINTSFTYFPKIKEAEQAAAIQQARLDLTELGTRPTLNASASYNYVNPTPFAEFSTPLGVSRIAFQPHNNVNTGLSFSWPIFDFGKLKAQIEKSKQELNASQHQIDAAKNNLAAQITQIYYGLIYYKKAITIQDSIINYWNESLVIVQKNIKNGTALELDELNVRASLDAEKNRKEDILNAFQKQLNLLEYTSGLAAITGNEFDFNVDLKIEQIQKNAEQFHPEYQIANDRILQAKAEQQLGKTNYYPIVALNANTGFKNGIQPNIYEMRFNYVAGMSLSVPIYNGGRTKQNLQLASANLKLHEVFLQSLKETTDRDIKQASADIQTNTNRIELLKSQMNQAIAALNITNSRFKNGVATHLELTNAIANVQRAELSSLQAKYLLILAKIELARINGTQFWNN